MATTKFKAESPFAGEARSHHASDFKYQKYFDNVNLDEHTGLSVVTLALFGVGRAGMIHLSNILGNPRINLKYIVDMDEERCKLVKDKWNLTDVEFLTPKTVSKIYSDPEVTACLIATTTYTHEEYIVDSLKAGKAVFSEKPISQESAGTARCYEEADKADKPLFCAFNRRFDPSFYRVYKAVREGDLGHIQMIKTTSRDSPLPSEAYLKVSGGIFHDCAVHDIDLITWILGEYPTEVYSAANAQIPEIKAMDDFDNVTITMKFGSGTLALIDLSRFACYGYDQRLEAFGPKGMLDVANDEPNRSVHSTSTGSNRLPMYYSFPSRHSDGYQIELNHFLDVALGKVKSSVDGRMTMAVSKIADACELSAKTGQPVKMEWSKEEVPEGYIMQ